jgi:hypothetical protein
MTRLGGSIAIAALATMAWTGAARAGGYVCAYDYPYTCPSNYNYYGTGTGYYYYTPGERYYAYAAHDYGYAYPYRPGYYREINLPNYYAPGYGIGLDPMASDWCCGWSGGTFVQAFPDLREPHTHR